MKRIALAFAAWGVLTLALCLLARAAFGPISADVVMVVIALALVLLPPSIDPAIQIKERREARRRPKGLPPPVHWNCRCNASPHALPGETEADTIGRLLKNARHK